MRQHGASDLVDQRTDTVTPRQLALLLHQPHLQHLGLDAALVEWEAVALPLVCAFGFDLADVGPAAIEVPQLMPTR